MESNAKIFSGRGSRYLAEKIAKKPTEVFRALFQNVLILVFILENQIQGLDRGTTRFVN